MSGLWILNLPPASSKIFRRTPILVLDKSETVLIPLDFKSLCFGDVTFYYEGSNVIFIYLKIIIYRVIFK